VVFTFSTRWRTRHTSTRRCVSAHTPPPRPAVRMDAHARHTHSHMRPFIRAPNRSPAALATAIDRKLPSPPRRLLLLLRHSPNKKSAKFPSPNRATATAVTTKLLRTIFSQFVGECIIMCYEHATWVVRLARILKVTRVTAGRTLSIFVSRDYTADMLLKLDRVTGS